MWKDKLLKSFTFYCFYFFVEEQIFYPQFYVDKKVLSFLRFFHFST